MCPKPRVSSTWTLELVLNLSCRVLFSFSWVFIHEKAYQEVDTGIESSVMTKVKGFGYHQNRVMDVADYVFPQQVRDADNAPLINCDL